MSPPFILSGHNVDDGLTPIYRRGVGGNPLGNFFVGFGNVSWTNNGDCIPPAGYLAGDHLWVLNSSSTLPGWSLIQSVPVLNHGAFLRIATGDANDNIPSARSGLIRQIFATRDNAEFTRNPTSVTRSYNTGGFDTYPVPANPFSVGGGASMIIYQGWRQSTAPGFVNADGLAMDITGTRIQGTSIAFVGIQFQAASVSVPLQQITYGLVEIDTPRTNTFRQTVNIL